MPNQEQMRHDVAKDLKDQGAFRIPGEQINLNQIDENQVEEIPMELKDLLPGLIESVIPLAEAINDIPQQIELLSRVTLARSFIGADGSFRIKAFEAAWAIISKSNED